MDMPGDLNIPDVDLPKELLDALDAAKAMPGCVVEDLLKRAIDKLAVMYGMVQKKEEPDPCQSQVEKVEVVVQTCIRTTEGKKVVSRHRSTTRLDPKQFQSNQSRQFERQHGEAGEPVKHVPIGKPYLTLSGTVIGSDCDPLLEPRHPDLRAEVERVANLVKFRMIWKDTLVYEHETTEQDLLDTPFRTHVVQIMHRTKARIGQEDNYDLSFGQIRRALYDVSKETMEAYQL
jgi:hypothetical protein